MRLRNRSGAPDTERVEPLDVVAPQGPWGPWFWRLQIVFWLCALAGTVIISVRSGTVVEGVWRGGLVDFTGFLLTIALHAALLRAAPAQAPERILLTILLAAPAAVIYAGATWVAFIMVSPETSPIVVAATARGPEALAALSLQSALPRLLAANLWFMLAWAGFYLALDAARRRDWARLEPDPGPARWFFGFEGFFWSALFLQASTIGLAALGENVDVARLVAAVAAGVALTWIAHVVLRRYRHMRNDRRVGLAVLTALALATAFAAVYAGFLDLAARADASAQRDSFDAFFEVWQRSAWAFAAWAGLHLAFDGAAGRVEAPAPVRAPPPLPLPTFARPAEPNGARAPVRWFWSFQFTYWIAIAIFSFSQDAAVGQESYGVWRLPAVILVGFAASMGMRSILEAVYVRRFRNRIIVALALCVPATVIYVLAIWTFYFEVQSIIPEIIANAPEDQHARILETYQLDRVFVRWMFLNLWFFVAWVGIYLAIDYAQRVRDQEGQLVAAASLAHEAHLKMLRFQLNPHFLFNTLNAISSLVLEKRNDDAEEMLMRLSRFLRYTLDTDPTLRVPLSAELEAQRLYLSIEKARFADRLQVTIDVPKALESAMVPSLILQPLVENAVKYAVAPSATGAAVAVRARADGERLTLTVTDDGSCPETAEHGGGVGLANIAERLRRLYGDAAGLVAGPRRDGGFEAVIRLPLDQEER